MIIDNEFKGLIPPLTDEEYKGLEESILKDGCRDALVLWGDTLIDGHNRYEICTRHNIPFETVQMDFESRDDVILWMISNQQGRRNLTEYANAELQMKYIEISAKKGKEKQLSKLKQNAHRFPEIGKTESNQKINTTKELAERTGIGKNKAGQMIIIHKEIEKAKADGTKVAGQDPDELRKKLRSDKKQSINGIYNAIKTEKKKEKVQQAEKQIAEQAADELKPVLHIGDSTKFKPTEKYDLLLTDPPYSTDVDDIEKFVGNWLYNALDGVKDTGFAFVFIGAYPKELKAYLNAKTPEHIELCQQLIWTYKNTLGNNPKDRYKQNYQSCLFYRGTNAPDLDCPLTAEQWAVQEINAPDGRQGDRYHAWQKPMEIAERFIRHSTKSGDIVYDPFACTGTFLLAAAKLGRKAYGFEINPDNAKIAFERGCIRG